MANKALNAWIHAFPLELQRMEFAQLAKDGTLSPEAQKILEEEGEKAIWFMPLSSKDRDEFELSFAKLDGKKGKGPDEEIKARVRMSNFTAKYVSFCWRDEKGVQMGTDKELGKLLPAVLMRDFYKIIVKMNGMEIDAEEEAGKD